MDNDAARHELVEALALLKEQLADLVAVEETRAALSATARCAEDTVVVTVNADGVVTDIVVSESYLADHDLADLGGHITAASQEAARNVSDRVSELLAPLAQRREQLPSLSDIVDGAPDIRDLLSPPGPARPGDEAGHEEPNGYPTVRSVR
ncbi:YbaB/EbfC family nucleoid-associated protein [Mycolicibacterium boenickei]